MKFEETMLDPGVAEMLLADQPMNRAISRAHVNKMKEDILAGRYMLNPNPISISPDGRLLDGQHRCLACVETATPIPVVIAWDVDPDVRPVLDGGRARSISDILRIDHPTITNTGTKSAAAAAVLKYRKYPTRIWSTSLPVTRQELEDELTSNADDYQVACSFGQNITTALGTGGRLVTRSALVALHIIVSRDSLNADELDAFAEGMRDPVAACRGNVQDPRYVYREQPKGTVWGNGQSALLAAIVAWNAHIDGRNLKIILSRRNMLPMPPVR